MDAYRPEHLLVTGGAGFIGSAYVRLALAADPARRVTVLDKLTYAGNLANLEEVRTDPRFRFVQGDIADPRAVAYLPGRGGCGGQLRRRDACGPLDPATPGSFVQTDVYGVYVLLEASLEAGIRRFVQVSTDEVYGEVAAGESREDDPAAAAQPLFGKQGGRRAVGPLLPDHPRPAGADHPRFQHLRPAPVP